MHGNIAVTADSTERSVWSDSNVWAPAYTRSSAACSYTKSAWMVKHSVLKVRVVSARAWKKSKHFICVKITRGLGTVPQFIRFQASTEPDTDMQYASATKVELLYIPILLTSMWDASDLNMVGLCGELEAWRSEWVWKKTRLRWASVPWKVYRNMPYHESEGDMAHVHLRRWQGIGFNNPVCCNLYLGMWWSGQVCLPEWINWLQLITSDDILWQKKIDIQN